MKPEHRKAWSNILRGGARLLERPEEFAEFRARFGLAAAETALKAAEKGGMPPELVQRIRSELGL